MKFHRQKVESTRNSKLWQLSGRFQTVIWRPGETIQNRESPRSSGRVDSTGHLAPGQIQKLRLFKYYSQLSLRQTPLGPALAVRRREMSVIESQIQGAKKGRDQL